MKKIFFAFMICMCTFAFANRIIKDQNGRTVSIPDVVNRVVVLQHQSLNVLVQLDSMNKVVGVLQSWKKELGENYVRLAPSLPKLPTPGDLKVINYEAILALKPDVVIVANYIPKEYIQKMEELKIPVVAMSFTQSGKNNIGKRDPTLSNEDLAYTNGLYSGIKLLGYIVNKDKNANELISYIKSQQKLLAKFRQDIKGKRKVRLYMANPDFTTYGKGKYTNTIFLHAGGENVAAKDIVGYKKVGPENIIAWDPDVIFVQERFPQVINELKNNPLLKNLRAIKENKIYLMPQYAKAWGHPTPEAMAIGEFWIAKKLYPKELKNVDINKMVQDYYKRFYRTNYIGND